MTDKAEWLLRAAKFQGRVQQVIASDVVEHGEPHFEREIEYKDLKAQCVELAAMAFQLHEHICQVEVQQATALLVVEQVIERINRGVQ